MRRVLRTVAIVVLLCSLLIPSAFADSPVGKWSGYASGEGYWFTASATFTSDGRVTLRTPEADAFGSWSNGHIDVSALIYTVTLNYSCAGDTLTITGELLGKSGRMDLRRVISTEKTKAQPASAANTLFREWRLDDGEVLTTLRIYAGGWLYICGEVMNGESGVLPVERELVEEFAAQWVLGSDCLFMMPLDPNASAPENWSGLWIEKMSAWRIPYLLEGDVLILGEGDVAVRFDGGGVMDAKPSEALLLPFITLEKGDAGHAVWLLQAYLRAAGYLNEAPSGVFRSSTQNAVKAYQKALGYKESGVADPAVMLHIAQGERREG